MEYIGSLEYDEKIKMATEIIVFGGGSMLPCLLKQMEKLDIVKNVIAVCDNNETMHGKDIEGIPVLAPEYVFDKYRESDFVVYNQYFMEICIQLKENCITKIHLIRQGSL